MLDSEKKISVIVPVYNTEKYLEKCVRSIMKQNYRNLEIICVNDGSTDGSLEILNRLSAEDDRIVVIDKKNGGRGDARNCGLEHVTSEWFTFVDSDDYIEPQTYEIVSKAFEYNPGIICFGIKVLTDSDIHIESDEDYYAVKQSGLVILDDNMRFQIDSSVCNKIFRKSTVEKHSMSFINVNYEDFPFAMQYLISVDTAFFIKDQLYNYIRHNGSIMSETFEKTPRASEHLDVYQFLVENLERNNMLAGHEELLAQSFLSCYYFVWNYNAKEKMREAMQLADKIYNKFDFLKDRVEKVMQHGCFRFRRRKHRSALDRLANKIFRIEVEYFDWEPYKVVRLFDILLYKRHK